VSQRSGDDPEIVQCIRYDCAGFGLRALFASNTRCATERQIAKTKAEIVEEREIKLLDAEWSNLTQPARLQALAEGQRTRRSRSIKSSLNRTHRAYRAGRSSS
jgi:hypothetical protein